MPRTVDLALEHDVNAEKVNVGVVVGQMEADRPTLMAQYLSIISNCVVADNLPKH